MTETAVEETISLVGVGAGAGACETCLQSLGFSTELSMVLAVFLSVGVRVFVDWYRTRPSVEKSSVEENAQ